MGKGIIGGIVVLGVLMLALSPRPLAGGNPNTLRNQVLSPKSSRLYKHPTLDFQFRASEGWARQPRPEDDLTYEVADPAESDLYMVQVWCPQSDYERHSSRMTDLLESVKVTTRVPYGGKEIPLYPELFEDRPELPSPFTTDEGREFVVARTKGGKFTILPVTVENGAPLDYNTNQWNKGRQLAVDDVDFPTLARTGLHSKAELDRTTSITGRSVDEITRVGRPGQSSGTGFMAEDEDILSVLGGDNELVARLGLTHPELARPLFQVFNIALRNLETYRRKQTPVNDIESIFHGERQVYLDFYGSKGWQESIFDDDVLGYYQMRMWRKLEPEEESYLREAYGHLGEEPLSGLMEQLTAVFTGEMVPFYIMRYGFYEGHTDYRADPIAIASVFGLLSIPEIDSALGGRLDEWLNRHYSQKP